MSFRASSAPFAGLINPDKIALIWVVLSAASKPFLVKTATAPATSANLTPIVEAIGNT